MTVVGVTTDYRYSDGGERYWKKTSGGSGEHYVLDGAATVGVFREDGTYQRNVLVGDARPDDGDRRLHRRRRRS